jgi:glycogen operon protein
MQKQAMPALGVLLTEKTAKFSVWSQHAEQIDLCLFDAAGDVQTARYAMQRGDDQIHRIEIPAIHPGQRYGFRAHGTYDPDNGFWFDPSKLLVDPYASELDRPFRHDARLSQFGVDTADLVPKAIVTRHTPAKLDKPLFSPGGLIYEVAVKPFTMLHPDIPETERGTVAALAHPSIIAHLQKIGVDAVELMPITAWIDERHLPPLGLTNGWGYNPVALMALDPHLCPGGMAELQDTVAKLHAAGIGVILDLVFNHTGESDRYGATLSLRGLDNLSCYSHVADNPGQLINDTGCGNTVNGDNPFIRQLIIDSLRHFVENAGVDGFRFDLAPIMFRTPHGFDAGGAMARAMLEDEILADRLLIAEPWDIGLGGYQLGNFPERFLEWNDRARDDLRRFWRGDDHMTGALATTLAGSSDIFARNGQTRTRTVNFLAAHDGFTLMDMVSNGHKHNEANGEDNRDGHNDNQSWNNGAEGATDDPQIVEHRRQDVMAMLATLFASRGTIMLTAGDEGGRSQRGNNNAYCQDNAITWMDWATLDEGLVSHTATLSALRKRFSVFSETRFFTGDGDIEWLSAAGGPMTVGDWEDASGPVLAAILPSLDRLNGKPVRLAVLINRSHQPQRFMLAAGGHWQELLSGNRFETVANIPARSVAYCIEA